MKFNITVEGPTHQILPNTVEDNVKDPEGATLTQKELTERVKSVQVKANHAVAQTGIESITLIEAAHSEIVTLLDEVYALQIKSESLEETLRAEEKEKLEQIAQLRGRLRSEQNFYDSITKKSGWFAFLIACIIAGNALTLFGIALMKYGYNNIIVQILTWDYTKVWITILVQLFCAKAAIIGWDKLKNERARKRKNSVQSGIYMRIAQIEKEIREQEKKMYAEKNRVNAYQKTRDYLHEMLRELDREMMEKPHQQEVALAAKAFDDAAIKARNAALKKKEDIEDLIKYISDLYTQKIEKQYIDSFDMETECDFSFTVWGDRITFLLESENCDGKSVDTEYRFREHRKANLTTLEEQQGLASALMLYVENEMRVRGFSVQAKRNEISDEQKWARKNVQTCVYMMCRSRNPYFVEEKKMV